MQLRYVTFEHSGYIQPVSLAQSYRDRWYRRIEKADENAEQRRAYWQKRIDMMVSLIEHLENATEASPHWVLTSHADVVLHDRNYSSYAQMVDEGGARVIISTMAEQYEITSAGTCRRTTDVREAGELVIEALKRPDRS